MTATVWLPLSSLLCSLQLSLGSSPKSLIAGKERHYLELSADGDIEARNIMIERNLRLAAHIMNEDEGEENRLCRTTGTFVYIVCGQIAKFCWNAVL